MRYGISMADIPLTTGQPDRGAGAYQFTGLTIYDPLIAWELDVADRPGKMIPGLATEWKVNEADKTLWTFKLRPGVKFHDGSALRRRCRDLEPREGLQQGRAAVRQAPVGAGAAAPAVDRELQEDRRHGGRDQDQVGRLALSLSAAVVPGLEPGAVGEARQGLEQVRVGAVGHRPVQARPPGAARARRAGEERRLLGSQARSQGRPPRPDLRARRIPAAPPR